MKHPWDSNTRLRPKEYSIGVNFRLLTLEIVKWIQKTYTTPQGRKKELPSQKQVAKLASRKFKIPISVGLVQKAVNVTELPA